MIHIFHVETSTSSILLVVQAQANSYFNLNVCSLLFQKLSYILHFFSFYVCFALVAFCLVLSFLFFALVAFCLVLFCHSCLFLLLSFCLVYCSLLWLRFVLLDITSGDIWIIILGTFG